MSCAAFFDLDRTLINVNSGVLWAKYEYKRGTIGHIEFARSMLWMILYHVSLVDMEAAYSHAVQHYKGVSKDEMDAITRQWFQEEIVSCVRPKALLAMQEHRDRGHPLVLLTSSSCFEAAAAAEEWGFDAWIANHFPDEDGRLLGEVQKPLVYGAGKLHTPDAMLINTGLILKTAIFTAILSPIAPC